MYAINIMSDVETIIVTLTLGLIFVVIGNSLPKLTQNKYAGFRTKDLASLWYIIISAFCYMVLENMSPVMKV